MKKISYKILALVIAAALLPLSVFAQTTQTLQNPLCSSGTAGCTANSIAGLLQNFLTIFSYIAVLFGVLVIIWIGFQFIMARGNPKKLAELSNWLLFVAVGIAVVIAARLIVQIVVNTLSATGTVNQQTLNSLQSVTTQTQ